MIEWFKEHDYLLWCLTGVSVITFLISVILLPILASKIPEDYFSRDVRPPSRFAAVHPVWRVVLMVLKNGAAAGLFLAGVAMLVLPGHGILAIAIALLMMDLPGKYKVERWMIMRSPVNKSINWVRKKTGHAPLQIPDDLMSPKPVQAAKLEPRPANPG